LKAERLATGPQSTSVQLLRKSVMGQMLADFEQGMAQIEDFLSAQLDPGTSGVAVFARACRRKNILW
jgi:hypothetical protein